jgi:probable phosphoglycerate mutase
MGLMGDLWLVRHAETEWSISGQHTGRTDLPLTPAGEVHAKNLSPLLSGHTFARVFTSPLKRAFDTCRLCGLGDHAEPDPNLLEWDYGAYEGRTTPDIRRSMPNWTIWEGPAQGGETADDVGRRADAFIARAQAVPGDVVAFAHGHILRILTARYLGFDAKGGRFFLLDAASVSVLSHEHETRVVRRWNERPQDLGERRP